MREIDKWLLDKISQEKVVDVKTLEKEARLIRNGWGGNALRDAFDRLHLTYIKSSNHDKQVYWAASHTLGSHWIWVRFQPICRGCWVDLEKAMERTEFIYVPDKLEGCPLPMTWYLTVDGEVNWTELSAFVDRKQNRWFKE